MTNCIMTSCTMSISPVMGFVSRFRSMHTAVVCLLASLTVSASVASAELRDDYKVIEPFAGFYVLASDSKQVARQKLEKQRPIANQVREMLRSDGAIVNDRKQIFENWFMKYQFPVMTLYTTEALKELPDERKHLLRDYMQTATNKEAHDLLTDMMFREFKKIAVEDYHPAVRYNAMLIVGEINRREMVRSGNEAAPPIPYLEAVPFMLAELEKAEEIDCVRLAAILGLQRHLQMEAQNDKKPAELKIPPGLLTQVSNALLKMVRNTEPPAGRSTAGHAWLRRRAVEALGWAAAIKPDQQLVDEIIKRIGDSEEDRGVRCQAILALTEAKLTAPVSLKTREVAATVGRSIVEAIESDIDRVETQNKLAIEALELYLGVSGSGVIGGGGMGMGAMRSGGAAARASGAGGKTRPPGTGTSRMAPGGTKVGTRNSGMGGMGSMGGIGAEGIPDPFAFRLEPTFRKERYEIGCAMRSLRGSDEYRKSPTPSTGLYAAAKTNPDDQKYVDDISKKLHDIAQKLKVEDEELDTTVFTTEVKSLTTDLNDVVTKGLKTAAKPALKPGKGKTAPAEPAGDAEFEPPVEAPKGPAPRDSAKAGKAVPAELPE